MTNDVMLRDIRSQGEALAEGLRSLRRQVADARGPIDAAPRRVILTGSGDSFIAPVATQVLFQQHCQAPVLSVPSLDASRYLAPGPGDLVVVVSVSGEVARAIEAAARAKASGANTVAVSAAAASTLATTCDAVAVIPPPLDRSIPHSRDYAVTMLALACILERVAGTILPQLDTLADVVNDLVERSFAALTALPSAPGRTWFLGAGPDRATAMFGALKFWEAAGMEAWWDDLEEFGHGSQLMARPGDRAVLIAAGPGCQRAREMVPGLERMGLEVLLVGGGGMKMDGRTHLGTIDNLTPSWHPFVSCVPLQVLTYLEAEARGLEVSVPLFGRPYGPIYDEVHVEWTKASKVVHGQEART